MATIAGRITFDVGRDNTELAVAGSPALGLDTGIQGITVQLVNLSNTVLATTTTDANGAYSFDGLAAGSYAVKIPSSLGDGRILARDNVAGAPNPPGSTTTGEPVYDSDFFSTRYNGVNAAGDGRSAFYTLGSTTQQLHIDGSYGFYDAAPANGIVDGRDTGEFMPVGYLDPQGDQITDGNDTIFGNGGDDDIRAGGGDDFVSGGIGNDFIDGGDGADNLNGDDGNDDIRGGAGDDAMFGGSGGDFMDGGDGADLLAGGADDDDMRGSAGNDTLFGESGNDFMDGGADDDELFGSTGNDVLVGGDGNDLLAGEDDDDFLDGGEGDDTLTGGQGNDIFTVSNGIDTITDFGDDVGDPDDGDPTNNDFVDLSGFYSQANYDAAVANGDIDPAVIKTPLQWLQADQADDGILNDTAAGWSATNTLTLENGGVAVDGAALTAETTNVVCFAAGTKIETATGEVRVEDLERGDPVLTMDNGYKEIVWIGSVKLSAEELEANPKLRPIRIPAGSLGMGLPSETLLVSPQHRVFIRSVIAERMVEQTEVLVAAKHLVGTAGIHIADDVSSVEYWHFLFDQHEVVWSNGAPTESMFTGPEAMKSVSPEARAEILELFPSLAQVDYLALNPSVRPILPGRQGRQLAKRHLGNGKPFLG